MDDRHVAPHVRVEDIEIVTEDGMTLRATVREPDGPPVGVAVLAHAMFARRTSFERPVGTGIARMFAARGWRAIYFDFRGHGSSGTPAGAGGRWGYDDLVRYDLPAVVHGARARADGWPVVVVGHSLGGHVALAAQATGRLGADALVLAASTIWMPACEPSWQRWVVKVATLRAFSEVSERVGHFPARALGRGTDDEALDYVRDTVRFGLGGRWTSFDGREDYLAATESITAPLITISSTGDRVTCPPPCARALAIHVQGAEHVVVTGSDDGSSAPGHASLVTSARALSAWHGVEESLRARLGLPAPR